MAGYLPGLVVRRIAGLHPGEAKTDAPDALIIAEAARTMPHTLRLIEVADEHVAELAVLCGFDDHLALERVLGQHLNHPAMPMFVRSRMRSRSNWANAPATCKTRRSVAGVCRSIP
ncbi:hypothetical protein GCM10008096_29190 [Zhihengliuella salsuginis]|uniref:Transposase IS110-like N-terminal domain-containing protein n=1 Tax=Zhihengliuella salsuginis TaxID=578222 RepID=A0ABQ3GKU3_9MICC|nr:hypothetical protein GCM10008096_29190 [Zhihengliuella salsuginis]